MYFDHQENDYRMTSETPNYRDHDDNDDNFVPLDSNWPFKDVQPRPYETPDEIYLVDSLKTGDTIAEFKTLKKAVIFASKANGCVRPYLPTIEEIEAQNASIRARKRYEQSYKVEV